MDKNKEDSSTIGAFVEGVGSTIIGIVVTIFILSAIIYGVRKLTGPPKVIQIVQNETPKDNGNKQS